MKGLLIFNKPKGITSHDVVYILRRKTGIKKIGHTGTLDPLAEGVLPMCIDKATKVAEYVSLNNKEYIAELEFGYATDSYDITGNIIEKCSYIPSRDEIVEALDKFRGDILQVPPMYSALKVNGKKLYELAREGKIIERKKRPVKIYDLEVLEFIDKKSIKIRVSCSSGTYIRSLIYDLGKETGSLATMTSLIRTRVGNYKIEDAVSKYELDNMSMEEFSKHIIPIDTALMHLEKFILPDWFYNRALNGVAFRLKNKIEDNKEYRVYCNNEFLGIGESKRDENDNSILKIKKLLV